MIEMCRDGGGNSLVVAKRLSKVRQVNVRCAIKERLELKHFYILLLRLLSKTLKTV